MFDTKTAYTKLRKSYSKNLPEYLAFLKKQYPEFVFQQYPNALKNEIPVFTLHSAEKEKFEEQMQFLARNEYQTLTADDFYQCLIGDKPVPDRAIVLTFDDGWESVWSVAYPLLKKYKFQAVSFIIPGLPGDGDTYYPNLEDFWSGNATIDVIRGRKNNFEPLCTWREIQDMHGSGTIDFQSHTMYHTLIFTSPVIEDFIHPSFDFYPKNFNVPIFRNNGTENISREADLGMPIYENAPRFSGRKRFFDDVEIRNVCVEHVKNNGDKNFFKKSNWRKILLELAVEYRNKYGESTRFETEEEQKENLYEDLLESKRRIEKKLNGKTVNHLCYPWWVGSDLAIDLSRKAGYLTNFWGIIEERRTRNKVGDDPYRASRLLGDEFIYRLPGEGRKPLLKIFEEKFLQNYKNFIKKISGQID